MNKPFTHDHLRALLAPLADEHSCDENIVARTDKPEVRENWTLVLPSYMVKPTILKTTTLKDAQNATWNHTTLTIKVRYAKTYVSYWTNGELRWGWAYNYGIDWRNGNSQSKAGYYYPDRPLKAWQRIQQLTEEYARD